MKFGFSEHIETHTFDIMPLGKLEVILGLQLDGEARPSDSSLQQLLPNFRL